MATTDVQKTAALKVPILPHTSPEAPQPPSLKTPLYSHQLRALHRCMLIETDGSLAKDFGAFHDYKSRGGCLADAVGMGKTATIIGLILSSPRNRGEGDTLVLVPGHLIHQWKTEIEKFTDDIEVLVGKRQYERHATLPPVGKSHRVILADVDSVIKENRYWYDWRRVYSDKNGYQIKVDSQKMEQYKKAALFCVKSPRGPCSYEGYVYTGPLHLPFRPWRRVIFDEIQDLVSEGTESQKNLLQLSRTAKNVWLLSATPFPHGNMSVYANHELLGFCRLKMDVEVDNELSRNHPFEIIKRKLYIRSPKHVADEAVTASQKVTQETVHVDATELERKFFELERNDIVSSNIFDEQYASLRQMLDHPEASKKLREQINGKDDDQRGGKKGKAVQQKNKRVGRFATVNSFARQSLNTARERVKEIERNDIPNTQKEIDLLRSSWYLALKIRQVRASPVQANPFARRDDSPPVCLEVEEANAIHQYYCRCPRLGSGTCEADHKAQFQTMGRQGTSPVAHSGYKSTERIIDYFKNEVKPGAKIPYGMADSPTDYLEVYIMVKQRQCGVNTEKKKSLETERAELETRIEGLEETVKVGNMKGMSEDEELAARNGSKPAALIHYLKEVQEKGEQTLVFSFWHDCLALVHKSLKNNGISVSFCNGSGNAMTKAITEFTSGEVQVLLLSAQAKASGANLQCATNVILLDPAGSSAEHGATLEQQAIGRAVRMGQKQPVKVIRFCVTASIEEHLFEEIDLAAAKLVTRNNDNNYMCENAHKSLDKKVLQKEKREEDEEVLIGETVSVRELLARTMAEARAKNEIIVIDDSDDDATVSLGGKPKSAPTDVPMTVAVKSNSTMKVKPESSTEIAAHAKRTNEEVSETEVSTGPDKRARVSIETGAPSSNPTEAVMQDGAPTVSIEKEIPSTAEDSLKSEYAKAEEEYKKFCVHVMNSRDVHWLEMLVALKRVKETSGIAWVKGAHSPLGKWCKSQRDMMRKKMKGEKSALLEGRIKMLNDIEFEWGTAAATPRKLTTVVQDAGARVVTPASEVPKNTVTVVVTKPSIDAKLGIGVFQKTGELEIKVTSIAPDSLFAGTGLMVGMKIETVNGGRFARFKQCVDFLKTAVGQLTIVASLVTPAVEVPEANASPAASLTTPGKVQAETTDDEGKRAADEEALKALLEKCELGHYLEKFQCIQIISASQLLSNLTDLAFMQRLVQATGLTATEAIQLQILASKQ